MCLGPSLLPPGWGKFCALCNTRCLAFLDLPVLQAGPWDVSASGDVAPLRHLSLLPRIRHQRQQRSSCRQQKLWMIFLLGFPPVLMSSPSTRLVRTVSSSSRRYWLVPSLSITLGSAVSFLLFSQAPVRSVLDETKAPCCWCSCSWASEPVAPLWGRGASGAHSVQLCQSPALCCSPRAAGLWVQVVPSLPSLLPSSLQCSSGHTVLDRPRGTVDELSGCHGLVVS